MSSDMAAIDATLKALWDNTPATAAIINIDERDLEHIRRVLKNGFERKAQPAMHWSTDAIRSYLAAKQTWPPEPRATRNRPHSKRHHTAQPAECRYKDYRADFFNLVYWPLRAYCQRRFYLRGTSSLGILNTALGCLFNVVLVRGVDHDTHKTNFWRLERATDWPPGGPCAKDHEARAIWLWRRRE